MSEKKVGKGSPAEGTTPGKKEEDPALKKTPSDGTADGAAPGIKGEKEKGPRAGGEEPAAEARADSAAEEADPKVPGEPSEDLGPSETPDGEAAEESGTEKGREDAREDESQRYMRLAADFQNFKKRTEKEKADIYAFANEKFAADLLEVLDNFERAVAQDNVEGADAKFLEGMEMILSQLKNVLAKNNVEEIAAIGEEFDPNVHHAVLMESSETYESGRVTDVMQKGYRLKDKVVRPAMVKVSQ